MDLTAFKDSLSQDVPPAGIDTGLQALWQDAKGNWDEAHRLSQATPDPLGAWVHAYLHRVEGDESNAGYWYKRAEKPHCKDPLPEEWEQIAVDLLGR
ncbi:MAG: hypothetical protein GKR89_14975 [Candidatus Latescibacteria bacterium]|nr:hypothetical protein [Candidatus Latescibacterota bacterium]